MLSQQNPKDIIDNFKSLNILSTGQSMKEYSQQSQSATNGDSVAKSRNFGKVNAGKSNREVQLIVFNPPKIHDDIIDPKYDLKIQSAGNEYERRQFKNGPFTKQNSKLDINQTPQVNKIYFPELAIESEKRSAKSIKDRQSLQAPQVSLKEQREKILRERISAYGIPQNSKFNRSINHELVKSEIKLHKNGQQPTNQSISHHKEESNLYQFPIIPKINKHVVMTPIKNLGASLSLSPSKKELQTQERTSIKGNRQQVSKTNQATIRLQPLNLTKDESSEIQKEQQKLLKIGSISQKGISTFYKKLQNQDSVLIKKQLCGKDNLYMLGIADGHGNNGHLVSKHIRKVLAANFEFEDKRFSKQQLKSRNIESLFDLDMSKDKKLFEESIKIILSKVFNSINKQLEAQRSFDISLSGSTLICAIVSDKLVILANCGDSRAVVFDKDGKVVLETIDHKPERPDEKQRIECQYKGRVKKQKQLASFKQAHSGHQNGGVITGVSPKDDDAEDEGVYRVWSQLVDLPGLAMSRSIGDGMAKSLGVIAEPEIQILEYSEQYLGIALASDGIWDVYPTDELCQQVLLTLRETEGNTKETVNKIYASAKEKWIDLPQNQNTLKGSGLDIDDISLVLGIFNKDRLTQQRLSTLDHNDKQL